MTKGEHIISVLSNARVRFAELLRTTYTDDDVRGVVNTAVVATELFLKDAIYARKRDKKSFEELIDGLAAFGADASDIASLQNVRKLYNKAHHSVSLPFSLGDAIETLDAAGRSVDSLVAKNMANTGADARPAMRRVFWIAGWFQVNGGDVETDIIVPDSSITFTWSPFDSIYVKLCAWQTLEADCAQIGRVRPASLAVPATVLKRFEEVEDLVGCFEFEGDYRALLKLLAMAEDRQGLIPDLLRENSTAAMCQATSFAAVDFARTNAPSTDLDAIAEGVATIADRDYAAPKHVKAVLQYATRLARLLTLCRDWSGLLGPLSVPGEKFDDLISRGMAVPESPERALFAISADNVLLVANEFS